VRAVRALRIGSSLKTIALAVAFPLAFGAAFAIGCASGQPHMQAARDHLVSARAELQAADSDKGGHRVKAIEFVDAAIEQVDRGIEFAAARH